MRTVLFADFLQIVYVKNFNEIIFWETCWFMYNLFKNFKVPLSHNETVVFNIEFSEFWKHIFNCRSTTIILIQSIYFTCETCVHLLSVLSFHPWPLANNNLFSITTFAFLQFHINGIIEYVISCVCIFHIAFWGKHTIYRFSTNIFLPSKMLDWNDYLTDKVANLFTDFAREKCYIWTLFIFWICEYCIRGFILYL